MCAEAETAEAALELLEIVLPDIVVTDLKLPNLSGVDLLRKIKEQFPRAEVAIMTGHGSIESAVDAMRQGAYDYIEKPFRVEKLRQLLQRMAEKVRLVTRESIPARAREHGNAARRHHWHVGKNSRRDAHGFAAERYAHAGTDHRRKRNRQRTRRPRDSFSRATARRCRLSRWIAVRSCQR